MASLEKAIFQWRRGPNYCPCCEMPTGKIQRYYQRVAKRISKQLINKEIQQQLTDEIYKDEIE